MLDDKDKYPDTIEPVEDTTPKITYYRGGTVFRYMGDLFLYNRDKRILEQVLGRRKGLYVVPKRYEDDDTTLLDATAVEEQLHAGETVSGVQLMWPHDLPQIPQTFRVVYTGVNRDQITKKHEFYTRDPESCDYQAAVKFFSRTFLTDFRPYRIHIDIEATTVEVDIN